MESSAIARYIPQKSKKRVFPGTSSSCMEPDVIEISPPPRNRTSNSKAKAPKQNEVVYCEVIDVDMDEDRNEVMFVDRKVESNNKGKGPMAVPPGPSSAVQLDSSNNIHSSNKHESNNKGKDVAIMSLGPSSASKLDRMDWGPSKKSFAPGSNFFGSDSYTTADDYIFDDDYSLLQSHFDNIDLPSGIEAPIPWLTDALKMKKASTDWAAGHLHVAGPPSFWSLGGPAKSRNFSAIWRGSTYSSSSQAQSNPVNAPSVETPLKVDMPSHYTFASHYLNNSNTQAGMGTSSFPPLPFGSGFPLGVDASGSKWHSSEGIMTTYLDTSDSYSVHFNTSEPADMEDMLVDQDAENSAGVVQNEDVLQKYENFKKFDTVLDFSDHYYSTQSSANKQPPKNWAKKIQDEWRILEKDLPDTIFVRVYESRMDLLRAVIIGAEGTPYHDGLFFFDVCFPSNYPNVPPLVHYHSGGLRINPNLYNCGKVCLSLLNTWTGGQKERWLPGVSTMLQVLVSIQGLILNTKPYFNEPGFANSSGSVHGEQRSLIYNENTLVFSLKTMVYTMKKPPKNFEDLVIGHFRTRVRDILMACKAYIEGVQVGCLVRGGVQDVDEGGKSCSAKFKNDVASYIKTLVGSFKKIGANEAEEFLSLSEKISPLPAPAPAPAPSHPHAYATFGAGAGVGAGTGTAMAASYNFGYW